MLTSKLQEIAISDKFELAGGTQPKDVFLPVAQLEMMPQELENIDTLSQAMTPSNSLRCIYETLMGICCSDDT